MNFLALIKIMPKFFTGFYFIFIVFLSWLLKYKKDYNYNNKGNIVFKVILLRL